ncbi:MAG: hypothetical protein ACRD44_11490, partial [Bryobacteraceae bacterium]
MVSFYTTQQGMALYLSPWFSVLASLGIQTALLIVAWMIGFSRGRRVLLISVYVITAVVSIAFSYVSLYTWFSARERPAELQRKLYDELMAMSTGAEEKLTAAAAEGSRHVLALEEMTAAEKTHGYISRARDADPYLDQVREAVAREGQSYARDYREGTGAGVRYTAFERYAKLARQSQSQIDEARRAIATFRTGLKPDMPTGQQLRQFHAVHDAVPWAVVEQTLHQGKLERAAPPDYSLYADQQATGQEELLRGFQELVTAPGSRHIFAFTLAAFIDIIVFLLAYASGPYFFGSVEQRWATACATLDSADRQVFVCSLLRKMTPGPQGLARLDAAALTPGERQFCLLLASNGLAAARGEEGALY